MHSGMLKRLMIEKKRRNKWGGGEIAGENQYSAENISFHSWRFCLADEEVKQNDLLQDGF